YTCNLFLNGSYNVYNNTSNNIDARYNYWGTGDSTMIAESIYDKYDYSANGIVIFADFAQVPLLPTATTILSGDVWYHNGPLTAMNSAVLTVSDLGGSPVATSTTNISGHYAFTPFASGVYTLGIAPSDAVGGVNATDALIVLNHFAKIDTLLDIELSAADVNASASVNGTDALFILKRWANMIPTFPAGDWVYNSASLTINGNQVVNDFEMLCFGDVNSSYVPTDVAGGNVTLEYEGYQMIGSFGEFDVSITIKNTIEAGAVSFGLYFPEEFLEVTGADMIGAEGSAVVSVSDGIVRIGWADLDALSFNGEDVMFTLKCKAKDLSGLNTPIQFGLLESSEFTDVNAQPFPGINLSTTQLVTIATSTIENMDNGLWLAGNYPNPFSQSTTITYSIPADGFVTLKVMNILGETIAVPVNNNQESGEYSVEFSADRLEAGLYLYILEFSNADNTSRIINKMSVTR
ncbi:MAG: T9SS type A sorting domain-containing protein, partial [Bacteroidales bacterium]|nr:T9SS type A sorting domain-containing protein [Bacteroidales bacterium]